MPVLFTQQHLNLVGSIIGHIQDTALKETLVNHFAGHLRQHNARFDPAKWRACCSAGPSVQSFRCTRHERAFVANIVSTALAEGFELALGTAGRTVERVWLLSAIGHEPRQSLEFYQPSSAKPCARIALDYSGDIDPVEAMIGDIAVQSVKRAKDGQLTIS